MDDSVIVELFFKRSENAVAQTQEKYGKYCHSIAFNILHDEEDANETVNDTYLNAWNSIPPHRPQMLSTFLGKITRNLSLKKWREKTADKRGGGEATLTLDELEECIPDGETIEYELSVKELAQIVDAFLRTLPDNERRVFVRRYWYLDSISDICDQFGFGNSKVKMMLLRTREKLKKQLETEGVYL